MREIRVDLAAVVENYLSLRALCAPAQVMAIVKANAYGHGQIEVATALEEAGVDALGVADLAEAFTLRLAGIESRLMCWILSPEDDFASAVEQKIELGVSSFEVLEKVLATNPPVLHIKVDTGLGRNGFAQSDWEKLFESLAGKSVGMFSHLANTSTEDDFEQQRKFEAALETANRFDVKVTQRHLSASAGALQYPQMRYDMVRCGIAVYGLNPFEDRGIEEFALRPAMRVSAQVANVKRVPAGQGVSYGYRYITEDETNLALVPFGYFEGMPRVSVGAKVLISGKQYPVVGRVAMDQFVVDVGADRVAIGDEVVIFGDAAKGEPTAEDLGLSSGSINYEIVTRIGGRAQRVFE